MRLSKHSAFFLHFLSSVSLPLSMYCFLRLVVSSLPGSDSQPYFPLFFCIFLDGPEIGEVTFRVCMKQLKSLQTLLEVKNVIAKKQSCMKV